MAHLGSHWESLDTHLGALGHHFGAPEYQFDTFGHRFGRPRLHFEGAGTPHDHIFLIWRRFFRKY